jgi:hypothetical protein
LWVLSSRSDPAQSIEILRRAWSGLLDPRNPRDQVDHSSRAVIDATRPYEWRDKFPRVSGASRELKDKVRPTGATFSKKNYLPNSQSESGVQRLPGFAPAW